MERIGLIDVGSAGGLPLPWRDNEEYIKRILRIDPKESDSDSENDKTISCFLGKEDGELYAYDNNYGHVNYRSTNKEFFRKYFNEIDGQISHLGKYKRKINYVEDLEERKITVPCLTLDTLLSNMNAMSDFHFLKTDTQGADLDILKGASEFLKNSCVGIHIETFSIPYMNDAPLFRDIVEYCGMLGFQLSIVYPAHGSFGSQNDCVFFKTGISSDYMDTCLHCYGLLRNRTQEGYAKRSLFMPFW